MKNGLSTIFLLFLLATSASAQQPTDEPWQGIIRRFSLQYPQVIQKLKKAVTSDSANFLSVDCAPRILKSFEGKCLMTFRLPSKVRQRRSSTLQLLANPEVAFPFLPDEGREHGRPTEDLLLIYKRLEQKELELLRILYAPSPAISDVRIVTTKLNYDEKREVGRHVHPMKLVSSDCTLATVIENRGKCQMRFIHEVLKRKASNVSEFSAFPEVAAPYYYRHRPLARVPHSDLSLVYVPNSRNEKGEVLRIIHRPKMGKQTIISDKINYFN